MAKNKTYDIPVEIQREFARMISLETLRDLFIKLAPFGGYRMAKRAALEAQQANIKAWRMVYDIYPKLTLKHLRFDAVTGKVEHIEDK